MSLTDSRGVPVSTSNPAMLAALERATTLTASYFVDPLAEIERALAEDPDFVMGHCLRVALAVMSTERGALPMLADSLAAIDRCGAGANDRERAHAAAARAWLEGDFTRSVGLYGDILLDLPARSDRAADGAHRGLPAGTVADAARSAWPRCCRTGTRTCPATATCWACTPSGWRRRTCTTGPRRPAGGRCELDPRDPWSVHAVTHVMEMQGRTAEGIAG